MLHRAMNFGKYIRAKREELLKTLPDYTVRKVAARIGLEPSYLSKIERNIAAPPSEATIRRLAEALHENPDLLLAMAGKVSSDLRQIIMKRPKLFAEMIREFKNAPDHAILRVAREVRDGKW